MKMKQKTSLNVSAPTGGRPVLSPVWPKRPALLGLAALCAPMLIPAGQAADKAPAAGANTITKPAWLSEMSLSIKESYDNNVYGIGVDQKFMPAGVSTLKNLDSWVTTVSPKVGLTFIPLLPKDTVFQTLSAGYAPEFVTFHNQSSENFNAHRFPVAVKAKSGNFSANLENAFSYIDGGKYGVSYPNSLNSSYSTAFSRERREQLQDKGKISFRYDQEKWFARPTASTAFYDLQTVKRATTTVEGYQNYADRYDVNGGLDLGYKLNPDLALVAGYRYGHQYQEQYWFDAANLSSPSDYQRALVGVEGKIFSWLKMEVLGGPDFRNYEDNSPTHTTPVSNPHMTTYYTEGTATAEITPRDVLAFQCKLYQWVSSTGKNPYFESTYELSYRRKITSQLSGDFRLRMGSSDYTTANTASGLRDDRMFTLGAGLKYAFTSHLSADLAYMFDMGRNAQDYVVNPETRDIDHHVISFGGSLKF